jgi:hypothetical protein
MYAESDGESHFEDLEVPLIGTEVQPGVEWGLSEPVSVTSAVFVYRDEVSGPLTWHNAPRRQLVIRLSGEIDLEVSDGEVRRMLPGSILLAEDTTGKGHRSTRASGESVAVILPLAPQAQ